MTPTTKAGRALLDHELGDRQVEENDLYLSADEVRDAIVAIEREAAAEAEALRAERDRLREALESVCMAVEREQAARVDPGPGADWAIDASVELSLAVKEARTALRARVVEHGRRFHDHTHGTDGVRWEACERLSCSKDRAALATPAPAAPAYCDACGYRVTDDPGSCLRPDNHAAPAAPAEPEG